MDLANALMELEYWDPISFSSKIQHQVPSLKPNNTDIPFAQDLPLAVTINLSHRPKSDLYIDDTTTDSVESEENCLRAERAVLLAIEIVSRDVQKNPTRLNEITWCL